MRKLTKLTIRHYLRHSFKLKLIGIPMVLALGAAILLDITIPFFFKDFFDIVASTETPSPEVAETLIKIIFTVAGIYGLQWIFWRIAEFSTDYFVSKVSKNLSNEAFDYLHNHSYRFFTGSFVGALVKKVRKLSDSYDGLFVKMYWDLYPLALRVVATIGALFIVNRTIAFILAAWTLLYLFLSYLYAQFRLRYELKRSNAETNLTASLADTITNHINLKLFTSHEDEKKRFEEVTEDLRRKKKFCWNLGSIAEAVQAALMIGLEFIILYYAVQFWQEGQLTPGDFFLIEAYILVLFTELWDLGKIIRDIYTHFGDAEEIIEILNTKHEIKDKRGAKPLKITKAAVTFKKVGFAYTKGNTVIPNLDLKIKGGEKIALIGPSGGGKSTTVKLLLRLFDIQKGQIIIDRQDIKKVTQESLRSQISLVPQDPILFHRSLLENIRYGCPDASDKEVIAASKAAYCHEFIMKTKYKYGTFVGERGVKLSGGERQRIAIARAILKNAPILILDEATSSLDSQSELYIQEALEKLMEGKTTIVIAHRLSTIMKMDRIIVIKDGQIHETGTHKELTNKKNSIYKTLWELQAGGFIH